MKKYNMLPPKFFLKFFRWFCHPRMQQFIEGDLMEVYRQRYELMGKGKADLKFIIDVLLLFRPGIIRSFKIYKNSNNFDMFKSYFKIGWRNIFKNKGYSFINIGGLAMGMAVTILIGLWIWDELSFNKNFNHYNRIAQVWQFVTFDVEKVPYNSLPIPLGEELRNKYPDFESVSVSSYPKETILATDHKNLVCNGMYVEPEFTEMMSLKMISGRSGDLKDINTIMLSQTMAKDIFGQEDPISRTLTLNENSNLKITGIYEDFPHNSSFSGVSFLAPWDLLTSINDHAKFARDQWDENSFQLFVQLKPGRDFKKVSEKIRDIRMKRDDPPGYKPEFFLHPMNKWHLYAEFNNGQNSGGLITFVWLFGMIGIFVLVLACINFMNLATARSEKRAKEVGLRKSVGSARFQLISQFLNESLLTVSIAFILSIVLVQLMLPFFNEVAQKEIIILWTNPWFWLLGIAFCLITALLAGSYPALYLSSFEPVKVLKGTFRQKRMVVLPRKILVVLQFTVSITLMIGIVVVYRQIDFAQNRVVGYDRSGLIEVRDNNAQLVDHFDAIRNDLLNSGGIEEVSVSQGSITDDFGGTTGVSWRGKSHDTTPLLMANRIGHEYGKAVGWKVTEGRDFSRDQSTDKSAMILNESAANLMSFENSIDEMVRYNGNEYQVIGVVKDIIKGSPFKPVQPSFFILDYEGATVFNIKLAKQLSTSNAMDKVKEIFEKYNPAAPFEYNFVDEQYAQKFSQEVRIGKLSAVFTILAIFISYLGIFGLASFVAEQRTKEIGVRKVLGASILNLWKMLSKDFILLVLIASCIAIPVSYYFMSNWLQDYEYRTHISWWIFGASAIAALVITLFAVSFQAIKAAMMNPVKSLRSE